MSLSTTLWYFADPMCSWCWGFTSTFEKIKSEFDEKLKIALMLGGLRPGTTEPMSASLREDILHHWHEVHKMTGQAFNFEQALPEGFVYDTEPASRAVVTVADMAPDKIFPFFKSVQSAFYLNHIDVTNGEKLAELASNQGIARDKFLVNFESELAKQKTLQHFQAARQAGVTGFPSLILQDGDDYQFIAKGYRPFDQLQELIQNWIEQYAAEN